MRIGRPVARSIRVRSGQWMGDEQPDARSGKTYGVNQLHSRFVRGRDQVAKALPDSYQDHVRSGRACAAATPGIGVVSANQTSP